MRRLVTLALGLLATAARAAPAAAAAAPTVVATSTYPFAPPALAGDRVVAGVQRSTTTAYVYSLGGGVPRKRLLTNRVGRDQTPIVAYGASAQRVAAARVGGTGVQDFFSGPVGGPLTREATCQPWTEAAIVTPDVSAQLAAWPAQGCTDSRILIDDAGTTQTVDAGGYINALAVGGRFVAWVRLDKTTNPLSYILTVYDVDAHAPAYTVAVPPPGGLDVQSDGTAVMTTGAGAGTQCSTQPGERIVYFTRAEPTEHAGPAAACGPTVHASGNRVAFMRPLTGGDFQLVLSNLAGTAVQPVANFEAIDAPGFDFDGARVAWSETRCRDFAILSRDASDTSAPDAAVDCPVSVGKTVILRGDGTLHLSVSCRNGCKVLPNSTNEGLGIISPRWLHVRSGSGGTTQFTPFAPFDVEPGKRATLRIRLTSSQIATLKRKGRTSGRLKAIGQHIYVPSIARTIRAG
ncbi:MAG: hypothetical protein ACJ76V_01400 [Thermoleophilaceae bacterium]